MNAQGKQNKFALSIVQRLHACKTQLDILRLLREITADFGYQHFFVVNGPTTAAPCFSEAIVITSAPSEMVQTHEARTSAASNPLASILQKIGAPFEFRLDGSNVDTPADFRLFAEGVFSNDDLDCAFIVPVYHPDHGPAAVFFLGKRLPIGMEDTAILSLYAHLLHQKLRQVSAKPAKPGSPLTERERECLVWTSVGKTSVEIAKILNLSEHTVNHYLNNAARKFDAVNRTQAVAHGLRLGYID
ncbi:LuxR C-terminal-related transcriptional regulator [Hoeflea sp. AS60]|uniref:helix-turn-helix transcriptional regulator n=1 Tax=Hoeflea sp. AS60 TaxID=3135780 RepID=UPI003174E1AA